MSAHAPAVALPPATLFDNSPTYQMACRQLDTVAKAINLDPGIVQRLMVPKRSQIVTGKPVELGGCVGRKEATGRGAVYCVREAVDELKIRPVESTAVVQGFGNVGSVTCEELYNLGMKVIAIGDRYGAVRDKRGID